MLQNAGFEDIKITVKENGRDIVKDWIPGSGAENYVTSAYVTATKPRQAHGFRDGVFYGASAACCAVNRPLPAKSTNPFASAGLRPPCKCRNTTAFGARLSLPKTSRKYPPNHTPLQLSALNPQPTFLLPNNAIHARWTLTAFPCLPRSI